MERKLALSPGVHRVREIARSEPREDAVPGDGSVAKPLFLKQRSMAGAKSGKARKRSPKDAKSMVRSIGVGDADVGASQSGLPAGLLDGNSVYTFRLVYFTVLSSSAGGTIASAISLAPGVTSYPDWSSLISLFTECRMVRTSLRLVNIDPFYTVSTKSDLCVGFDDGQTNTAPSGVAAVFALPNAKVHSLSTPEVQVYSAKLGSREWAKTTSAAPGPYAGCYGQWSIYNTGLGASIGYCDAYLEVEVEMRNFGGA